MNSKYREFTQRQNIGGKEKPLQDEDYSMRQMFGDSPDSRAFAPNQSVKKKRKNIEDIPVPIKDSSFKKGFIGAGVILLIEAVFLLGYSDIMGFLGGLLMTLLSFLIAWKVQYRYTNETNFYFHNFTVTLKGLLNHYRATSVLMDASEKLFIYSIALMAVQHFLLFWFSLTSILYSVGYYGMLFGIILNLSKRKTLLISKGLVLYSIMLMIMTFQNVFGEFHYINYHTVISLFIFWYLAGFFKSVNIEEVHIDKSDKNVKMDFGSEADNLL